MSNPFIGTWRLVSVEGRTSDGQISYPFGDRPSGYIMYNEQGYMSVVLMSADRANFVSGDIRGGSSEEIKAAFETYQSYCGTYEIQGQQVLHHIEACHFPNWTGSTQVRFFELTGNRLMLSSPPFLVNGIRRSSHLIWERV